MIGEEEGRELMGFIRCNSLRVSKPRLSVTKDAPVDVADVFSRVSECEAPTPAQPTGMTRMLKGAVRRFSTAGFVSRGPSSSTDPQARPHPLSGPPRSPPAVVAKDASDKAEPRSQTCVPVPPSHIPPPPPPLPATAIESLSQPTDEQQGRSSSLDPVPQDKQQDDRMANSNRRSTKSVRLAQQFQFTAARGRGGRVRRSSLSGPASPIRTNTKYL